jgi:outer membrane protein
MSQYSFTRRALAAVMAGAMVLPANIFAQDTTQQPSGSPAQSTASAPAQQTQQTAPNAPSTNVPPEKSAVNVLVNKPTLRPANWDNYSKGKEFPNPLGAYTPRGIPEAIFGNTPRIQDLIREGVLYLSLNDAIALALENNLDIAIARYNLQIADTDVLRAKSGSNIRGVATGLVTGTQGGAAAAGTGAAGGGAGGTQTGAGGAGTGAFGIVQSTLGTTGGPIPQFDPSLNGTLQLEHATTPQSSTILTGTRELKQNTGVGNFSYNQGFATGTNLSVGFNNNRISSNSLFSQVNPAVNTNFRMTVSQHLLQGFGIGNNTRLIRIAKNNRQISDISFRNQVIASTSQIQNIYWDLVSAYEDVKVRERSLALANRTLSDNRKQVEIGTLAPIEIVRAESEAAARNQELIVSQTNLQLQQTFMKNAISRSLADPMLAAVPVIPTDRMIVTSEPVPSVDELVKTALENSPDYAQSLIDLTNRDINKKAARNALLPTLDLFGFYGASGLGGVQNPNQACDTIVVGGVIQNPCFPTTNFTSAFGSLFDSSGPDKGAGISLIIPIRNRSAQADQVRSELEYRQAELRLQQQQNTIGINVRNAQFTVQQNRARVEAAVKGRELAQQSLDAEQKRYQLGASTSFNVLQSQRDLVQAESNYVAAVAAYEKSRVSLDQVTGLTLQRNNISLDDAVSGRVTSMPTVPGVQPAPPQINTPTSQQQPPPSASLQ